MKLFTLDGRLIERASGSLAPGDASLVAVALSQLLGLPDRPSGRRAARN
jgi:hypothetical protein